MWTLRGIRSRYKQTAFGGAWAVIQPVSLMVIFTIVFSRFVQIDTGGVPYPVFSYVALLPWTFFSSSLTSAIPSLVENMHLITKVYFPREILPLSQIGARLVDFVIAAVVLLGMVLFYRLGAYPTWLWIPVILVVQLALSAGIGLLGAAINVFYRDIRHAIVLLVQIWMYATPVIYPISVVPEQYRTLYSLNPMVGLIESYRYVLLDGKSPPMDLLALSASISLALMVLAYWYFKRVEWLFGDII